MRRVIAALVLSVLVWALLGLPASAGIYPPVPDEPSIQAPKARVARVVVVRGAPVRAGQALVRTGTSSTLPLIAVAVGSVVLGVTLVGVTRRRQLAELPAGTPTG